VGAKKPEPTTGCGSADGEWAILSGRLLGGWRVDTDPNGNAWVQVEEYKRPTFEVHFKDAEKSMRLNQPAAVMGEAKYYFGQPLSSGNARWTVVRTPRYPWWWDFGYWSGTFSTGAETIATGSTPLSADGTFAV